MAELCGHDLPAGVLRVAGRARLGTARRLSYALGRDGTPRRHRNRLRRLLRAAARPEATAMAVFPARDREAFDAHWWRLLADDSLVKRTIVDGGAAAGNIGCW